LATPGLFDGETDSDDLTSDTAGEKHQALATACVEVLEKAKLASAFRLESGDSFVKLENLLGMVARDRMLSDAIIDFSIRCICDWFGNSYAMDSFASTVGCPNPPKSKIATFQFVVLPVLLNQNHWGVTIVHLSYLQDHPCMTPYYYESLCSDAYRDTMEDTYNETEGPFLRDWHSASMPAETEPPVEQEGIWFGGPKQPDGTSCGVMAIAQVYDTLIGNSRFVNTTVAREDIAIMRLRILWMILMQPDLTTTVVLSSGSSKIARRKSQCRHDADWLKFSRYLAAFHFYLASILVQFSKAQQQVKSTPSHRNMPLQSEVTIASSSPLQSSERPQLAVSEAGNITPDAREAVVAPLAGGDTVCLSSALGTPAQGPIRSKRSPRSR
jgi:hypothetical protein